MRRVVIFLFVLTFISALIVIYDAIPSVKATTWFEIKRFYYNADRLEETTDTFTCNHVNWRIKWEYHPWYGGSVFNITVYKVGVSEPVAEIHDIQYYYILTKTGERYIDGNNGTFFLKINAVNIAYYYEIMIEQDIDSPCGLPISKFNTSITLAINPQNVKMKRQTMINATLLCQHYYQPVPNQNISFYIGTTYIGSATTDSYGNAVITYVASIDTGNHSITAIYDGSLDFLSCNTTTNLIVSPLETFLTIENPSNAIQGRPITLKATLKDELGNPIRGVDIEFQLFNGSIWLTIGLANTDLNGTASLNCTLSNTGPFQLKALFNGTPNYSQTSSTTKSLSVGTNPVGTDPILYYYAIIAIAMVILFGAVGYIAFRKRRSNVKNNVTH